MNIYLHCNSDTANCVENDVGGEDGIAVGVHKSFFCYLLFRGCFNCWWVRCGGVWQKILFRTVLNRMFLFIQGCESEYKISLRDLRAEKIFLRPLPSC